jgi:hypothetical protein
MLAAKTLARRFSVGGRMQSIPEQGTNGAVARWQKTA